MISFFFNDTATTEIYTLSLHDALPISGLDHSAAAGRCGVEPADREPQPRLDLGRPGTCQHDVVDAPVGVQRDQPGDRKSTRLNSSHANISYAVFCLKKKKHPETL